ncbi:hypothetical protein K2X33_06190 [bacterium]|nr:hypothetical protein [bacterium]
MPKTPKVKSKPKATAKDPLYQLFEHFLMTRSYENPAEFTKQLADNYMAYLDSTPAHIPFEARQTALEDLATEAHEMLVKRMYGGFGPHEADINGLVHRFEDGRIVDTHPLAMPEVPKAPEKD